MRKISDILIPNPDTSHRGNLDFLTHADPVELWQKNIRKIGKEWHYRNHRISYKFNTLGYRMPELDKIDYDNYIIFFGCSNTVGIGLEIEHTFSYMIANKLNCEYINAAVGGSSPDFVINNLVYFLNRTPARPRAVIINWPTIERTFYWNNQKDAEFKIPSDISTFDLKIRNQTWTDSYLEFLDNQYHINRRMQFLRETAQLLCSGRNIILCEFSTYQTQLHEAMMDLPEPILVQPDSIRDDDRDPIGSDDILHQRWARDIKIINGNIVAHPGWDHQEWVTDMVVSKIRNKLG